MRRPGLVDFFDWSDAVGRVVIAYAGFLGLQVHRVGRASSGTLYVRLRRSVGGVVVVRIADHRPHRSERRQLTVRWQKPDKLALVFLCLDKFARGHEPGIRG